MQVRGKEMSWDARGVPPHAPLLPAKGRALGAKSSEGEIALQGYLARKKQYPPYGSGGGGAFENPPPVGPHSSPMPRDLW